MTAAAAPPLANSSCPPQQSPVPVAPHVAAVMPYTDQRNRRGPDYLRLPLDWRAAGLITLPPAVALSLGPRSGFSGRHSAVVSGETGGG